MKPEGLLDSTFRQMLENVAMVALALDSQGRVNFANDFLLDLTGWSREEVVGRDWFSLFLPADDAETMREIFAAAMATGDTRARYESDIVTRDGERRRIAFSNVVQLDEHRGSVGMISLGEDVTDRRRADERLRAREVFFRSLIENAADVIVINAADGTSLYESPSVERVLGWKPDELVGGSNFELLHEDDRERARRAFVAVVGGDEPGPIEFRLRHRDGSWRVVEAIGRRHLQDGEWVVVTNYRDVTEQLQLREQLLHAQKLEVVGRLAGGIAHDFNNLLTAIGGYSEVLLSSFDEDDPRRQDALEIVHASERAATLTAQLLSFSRQQVVVPEVLDLGDVVAALESTLSRLIGPEVTLVTRVESGGCVRADRGQLGLVVTNMAVNAVDAMPSGGRIELSVTCREGEVELTMRDSGGGMDADTLAHLWEPFFTTKEAREGAGLGLATVYGIVTQMGGTVSAVSEPGEGACFTVVLPRVEEAVTPAPPVQAGTETILFAEDEETIRRLVTQMLTRQGYTVIAAATGAEALELLAEHGEAVDLLLTDVLMPGMTGTDLFRAAAEVSPSLRVVFTSGYTQEQHVFDDPGVAFIGKPFTTAALLAKLREVLDAG